MRQIITHLLLLIAVCLIILILIRKNITYENFSGDIADPKWAIVQYDDRPLGSDEQSLININKEYARKNGYEYIFLTSGYEQLPPYWIKVAAVRDLLLTNKYKGVCWIDTDAVFVNHSQSIDSLCNGDITQSFYMAGDPPLWNSGKFNAGVWFVRNSATGIDIMNYWMKCWDSVSKDWIKLGTKWKCNTMWAGPSYEQGAFIKNLVENNNYNKYIKSVPYEYLQTINPKTPGAFVLHFSGNQKKEIPQFLSTWAK